MLGAFVTPVLFWGGAAAMAAPVIIHLLARRRFQRVRWAAMDFLIQAERRNRRRVRLEELILLALRCLAVLLVALVVSRPFIRPTGVAAILGGTDRTERIFVIDDSFSMGYVSAQQSAFERARASAINLLTRLREHAPSDTVTVLRTSAMEKPVVTGAVLDDRQFEDLLARLEALAPSQRGMKVDAVMAGVRRVLENDPGVVSACVYVLSDFQQRDWTPGQRGSEQTSGLAEPLTAWAGDQRSARVVLVDVGDDGADNLAITALRPLQRQWVTGVDARLEAAVGNFSRRAAEGLELQVTTGQAARASARLAQAPPATVSHVAIPVVFQRGGEATVRVEAGEDNLPVDNVRYLAAEVNEAIRILVVNGEPSADHYLDEVDLLVTALRPEGDVFSGNQVDIIEESQLDDARFNDYHLVILCNLYRVSELAADALHRYVHAGGGLAIFLGDQVGDPVIYNAALFRDGQGLLPASLQTIVRAPEPGALLAGADFLHPVVRVFAGQDNPFLQRIRFQQYYATEPAGADETDAPPTAGEFRPAANVIARYDDAERSPAIVERPYGAGRVMLFTSSADLEWNDWAKDPSYVVAMLEIAQHLARSSAASRTTQVGEPLRLPLDPSRFEQTAVVRGPGYPQQEQELITATPDDAGGLHLTWPYTEQAGIYTMLLQPRTGGEEVRRFAVNLDAGESDLTPAPEDALRTVFSGLPVEYVAGVASADDEADEGRRELWPAFLALAMAVLMLEQFLAWRFGRA